jgi:ABC-2 type transport system permease protein
MLRIAWRLQRVGTFGMSGFGVLYGAIQAGAYSSAAGTSAATRAAFGRQMEIFGRQFSTILPLPVRVDTLSGYMQWRVYGALPLLFGFWALMSAAGATRGDEERGLVEGWLSAGIARGRYLLVRFLAFAIAAVISVTLTSAAIDLGAETAGSPLDVGGVVEMSVALLAITLACYGIALAIAQAPAARNAAAGMGGAVLLAMFFVNGFSRTVDSLKPVARIVSPFYYYERNSPLTPGGSFDVAATAGLLVAAAAMVALAMLLMKARDIGAPLLRRTERQHPVIHQPSSNPLLRVPVLATLYEQRLGLTAWAVGAALLAWYFASISRTVVDLVTGPSGFRAYLVLVGHGNPYVAISGFFWFGTFQLLLAVYAVTRVARWSSDDNEGRLEMVLSAPVSRWRVVAERGAAFLVGTSVVVAVSSAAFYFAAASANIDLRASDLAVSSLALLPFVLSFAAVGAVLASVVPRATVGILATLAFLSYLVTELGPLMKWPDWVLKLSVFSLYGTPLTSGVYWTGMWILLAVVVLGFGLAAVLMQRREVGR